MAMKRWLGLTLAAALAFSSASGGTLWAATETKSAVSSAASVNLDGTAQQQILEQLIPAVREKIGVPETLNQFSSDYWTSSEGGSFNLRWWRDENYASISVTVMPSGEILSLYKYDESDDAQLMHFVSLSKVEAKQKADVLLEMLAPEMIDQLSLEATVSYDRYSGYRVSYQREIDGVPVQNQFLNINLDPNTGELRGMDRSWQSSTFVNIENKANLISEEKALQALRDKLGLKLHYRMSYSYYSSPSSTERPVFLEYTWNNYQSFSIDAKTGELYTPPTYESIFLGAKGMGLGFSSMAQTEDSVAYEKQALTPEEQKQIDSLQGLLSGEAAVAQLFALPYLALDDGFSLSNARYSQDYYDKDKTVISLTLLSGTGEGQKNAYAQLDAKTGELISFSAHAYQPYAAAASITESKVQRDAAQVTAEAFLKQAKPQLWQQVKLQSAVNNNYLYRTAHYFNYDRQVDGIPFEQNGLYVEVDYQSGKIVSFNQSWNEKLVFPSKAKAISVDKAYEALLAIDKPSLYYLSVYHQTEEQQVDDEQPLMISYDAKLVYGANILPNLSVDALSGEVKQYDQLYSEQNTMFAYADLADHEDADKIQAVAEHLGFEAMESFRPQDHITQVEWLRWVTLLSSGWVDINDDTFYRNAVLRGLLTDEERDPDVALTALDGAKYLVRALGFGSYAKLGQPIFVNPLKLDNELAAYAALAAGVKAIDLKAFEPDAALTRHQAVLMLYDYLSR